MQHSNIKIEYSNISIINEELFIFSSLESEKHSILSKTYKNDLFKENNNWQLRFITNVDFIEKANKLVDIGICFNQGISMGDMDLTPAQRISSLQEDGIIKKSFISFSRVGLHIKHANKSSSLFIKIKK